MAELGIIASFVKIADLGVRLSLRLYTFGETVASADKSINSISKDVSLTSSVLKELGLTLEKDQESRVCSENAFQAANEIVKECSEVFQSMDKALTKSMSRLGSQHGEKRVTTLAVLERLKWPFLQPRMQLLRSNLERLKSTLLLMLNVITYARQVADKTEPQVVIDKQRAVIEDLGRLNMNYSRRYKALTLAIGTSHSEDNGGNPQSTQASSSKTSRSIDTTKSAIDGGISSNNDAKPRSPSLDWGRHQKSSALNQEFSSHQQTDVAVDKLMHYCSLINTLLEEVDSVEYKIEDDLRLRIRDDVVNTHRRERRQMHIMHGHKKLKQAITGKALSSVEMDSVALESQIMNTHTPALETRTFHEEPHDSHNHRNYPKPHRSGPDLNASRNRRPSTPSAVISLFKRSFELPLSYVRSIYPRRRKVTLSSILPTLTRESQYSSPDHRRLGSKVNTRSSSADLYGEMQRQAMKRAKIERHLHSYPLGHAEGIHTNIERSDDGASTSEETAHFENPLGRRSDKVEAAEATNAPVLAENSRRRDDRRQSHETVNAGGVDAKPSGEMFMSSGGHDELPSARAAASASGKTFQSSSWLKSPSEVTILNHTAGVETHRHSRFISESGFLGPTTEDHRWHRSSFDSSIRNYYANGLPANPSNIVNDLLKQWTILAPDTISSS